MCRRRRQVYGKKRRMRETNLQEQDADMLKESKGYVPNDELEDENEEEERYIRVLHNKRSEKSF